ncbi:MAG: TonB-dependent receptor [Prevotella sp.]|nr:TonB-dependent receptor [Prevotella sp.]MCM1075374.1 TonB-dependent receptor [Ruminococcus sp.]
MNANRILSVSTICLAGIGMLYAQEPEVLYADTLPGQQPFDEKVLEEITVVGDKPIIQASADKVTYIMEEDPSAQTATASDMLRKVPMITVDADGNIKLKGESNFQIYLNGKPNPALSANYKDILKAMPASMIKKVEVITDPGAKYDAEGVGGIINIITESQAKVNGYSATVTATGSRQNIGGGVNAMAKFNKVSLNLNYNHSYNMIDGMQQTSSIEYLKNNTDHLYKATTEMDLHNNFDFGGLQAAWEPNDKNLFTASANLFNVNLPFSTRVNYGMYDIAGNKQWSYASLSDFKHKYLSYTLGANWQHNFNSPEHNIVLLYQYSRNMSHQTETSIYDDYANYPGTLPGLRQDTKYPDNEHTFQFDYTLPFAQKHTLETGAKYIMRRNTGDTYRYNSEDGIAWIYDEAMSVSMKQHQDVVAVYGAYTGKFAAWTVKGGLRYEYTRLSSKFLTPGHTDFSQNLNDLVPNVMINYTMPDYSSLRLSYQMRITRPSLEQLNPYHKETSTLNFTYGNPELVSQKANNVSLTYSNFSLPVQLNVSLGYNYTDRMILDYRYLGADGVMYTTYGNYGHCNRGTLFVYASYPIIQGMRLSVNTGVDYKDYKSGKVNVHNHGWGWNAGGDFSYEMPWDLELSAYGGAGSMGVTFQGKGASWNYHGLGLTKSLLNEKRLRITLSATNFCTPTRTFGDVNYTPDIITRNVSKMSLWNVGVSVSYRIGSFNQRMKTTTKTIYNDDVNQSSSGSGIGSMPTNGAGQGSAPGM